MTARTDRPTPGPWWVAPNATSIMCGDPSDPEIVATVAVTDLMGVCSRARGTTFGQARIGADGWDESEANARLIASAPALLAERDALREQVKTLREAASMSLSVLLAVANGETDDYPERCRAAATCARAALASTETEVQP